MAGTEKTCSCIPSLELRENVFLGNPNIVISSTAELPWQLLVHQTQGSTEMAIFK